MGWWVCGLTHSEPLWSAVNETETMNAEPVAGVAGTVVVADLITFLDYNQSGQHASCRRAEPQRATRARAPG